MVPDTDMLATVYVCGPLRILVGKEPMGMHISISHPTRYPTWGEIKHIKYTLYPDNNMAMFFPPKDQFVNISKNCFHLLEVPTEK